MRTSWQPLIVVQGSPAAVDDAIYELRTEGWVVVDGWQGARVGVVCSGTVTSPEEAAAALLAAVAGAGIVIGVEAERVVVERLCDDLRRFGPVDFRTASTPPRSALSVEERMLLELLAQGRTLGEAAAEANMSRRTADRRIASAREKLGVRSTAEAVIRLRRSR